MKTRHLGRVVDCLCARFPLLRKASGKLEVRSLRKYVRVRAMVLLYSAVIPSPTLARAEPQLAATFRFLRATREVSAFGTAVHRSSRFKVIPHVAPERMPPSKASPTRVMKPFSI
jgi:hypothetical protein